VNFIKPDKIVILRKRGDNLENFELLKELKNLNINKINLSTSGNLTLQVNSIYEVVSNSVKNSIFTLPTGTDAGQIIEVLVSVTGFDENNTFTITGNINGINSNTITIRGSFVDYKFIWSQTSQTWVSPHTVIN
jgi:hypothetical protein